MYNILLFNPFMRCNDAASRPIRSGVNIALSAVSAPQTVFEAGNRKIATQAADQRGHGEAPRARAAMTPNPDAKPLCGETREGKR